MSDIQQLGTEFIWSFQTYVDDDGRDVRRETLKRLLKEPVEKLVELMEPHDLAALMSCAVFIDPRDPHAQLLKDEYEQWLSQYDDDNPVQSNVDMSDAPFEFDESVEELGAFFKSAPNVNGGNAYLIQIFVCLMWAHKIPEIKTNIWRPGR